MISYYKDVYTLAPTASVLIIDVLQNIKVGKYKTEIEIIRDALKNEQKEVVESLKLKLPAVTFSGTFRERRDNELLEHSKLLVADLDKLPDPQAVKTILSLDPYVAFIFISPSGNGLKVGFKINGHSHLKFFTAIQDYLESIYNLHIDKQCSNLSRLCFVSYDPEIYINLENAELFPKPTIKSNGTPLPKINDLFSSQHKFIREDVETMLQFIPPRPDYEIWIRIISAVCSVLPETEALSVLKAWSPEEKSNEYEKKFKNGLKHFGIGTLIYYAKTNTAINPL